MGVLIGQPGVNYTPGQTYKFPQGTFTYKQDGTFEPAGLTSRSVTTIPANSGDPYGASLMPSTGSKNSFYGGAMQPPDKGPGGTLVPSLQAPQYNASDYAGLYQGVEEAYKAAGIPVPADVGTFYQTQATAKPKTSIPAPPPAQSLPSGLTKTNSYQTGMAQLPAGVVPKSAQEGMTLAASLADQLTPSTGMSVAGLTDGEAGVPSVPSSTTQAPSLPTAPLSVPGVTQTADNSASDAISKVFGDAAAQPNAVKEAGGTAYQSTQDAMDGKWKWKPVNQTPDGITDPSSAASAPNNWRPNSIAMGTPSVPKAPPSNMVNIASGRTVPVGTQGTAQGGRYSYEVQPDGSVLNKTTGRTTSPATGQTAAAKTDTASGSELRAGEHNDPYATILGSLGKLLNPDKTTTSGDGGNLFSKVYDASPVGHIGQLLSGQPVQGGLLSLLNGWQDWGGGNSGNGNSIGSKWDSKTGTWTNQ